MILMVKIYDHKMYQKVLILKNKLVVGLGLVKVRNYYPAVVAEYSKPSVK